MSWLSRTETLIGEENIKKLAESHVLVVGLGGVGSFAAEYIARSGIGKMTIVDGDTIEFTNRNRQLPALVSSEGQSKALYMAERLKDINPNIILNVVNEYLNVEKMQQLFVNETTPLATASPSLKGGEQTPLLKKEGLAVASGVVFDYVIDAIDTIAPKIMLIRNCLDNKIPLVSAMGAGGRFDPEKIKIAPIWKTKNCQFAQQIRKNLRQIGITHNKGQDFMAVFSEELPDISRMKLVENQLHKKSYLGTISYMPSLFGAFCASVVIRNIIANHPSVA